MLKRIWIIAGILIVGIASFSLLNKSLEDDTAVAVANKEEQKPLFTKEDVTVKVKTTVSARLK
ncbi:hypothetical protein MKZ26_01960 [Sporosarcina sp. FSL K6-6792]|uniref:hypothetical protein n=1 Tax=Sporosarcina sp. FSL K6-6792 TaxID=2921559 RepID=UPI0030FC4DDB